MSISRQAAYLTTNLLLRRPIWWILRRLQRFSLFDYIFLIYPGDNSDINSFCPSWLAKTRLISRQPLIGGIITGKSRGLLLCVPNTAEDFRSNAETARIVLKKLIKHQKFIRAKSIALAGRLPGLVERHGFELKPPFVTGVRGTLFSIMDAIDRAAKKHSLDPAVARIGIVGVGKIGKALLDELEKLGWNVFGVDMYSALRAKTERGEVLCSASAAEALSGADIVVALTPTGTDFEPYLKHLKADAIVLDDTHPMIRRRPHGMHFYKVAVEMDRVLFRPKLPGYKQQWIPGCTVEAIVTANTLDFEMEQLAFNKAALDIGLRAVLA